MENEKVIAELLQRIKTLESRCDRYEKRSELFEEQFRQTCKDVQEINFNVVTILKLFDKLESRLNKDQEILHGRIGSLKRDFEEYQMKDLKDYYNYKRVIVNTILTLIIGGLVGGIITAWRVFGANG